MKTITNAVAELGDVHRLPEAFVRSADSCMNNEL